MADRERSRSRSPEGGAPPAEDANQNGDDQVPPAGDAPPAEGGDASGAGDDGADEVKLYVGNLDYGKSVAGVVNECLFVYISPNRHVVLCDFYSH